MEDEHHALDDLDFLTVEETEKICRVTRATVDGWLGAGELGHYRLGPRTIRIATADLEQFLLERREGDAIGLANRDVKALDFLTVEEVEKICRLTRSIVDGWLAAGLLQHYRLGPRTIRIDRADLDRFFIERRKGGAASSTRYGCSAPHADASEAA